MSETTLTHEAAAAWVATCQRQNQPPTITAEKLAEIAPFQPAPGFQPLSIAADPKTPNLFVIADYYAPAAVFVQLKTNPDGNLELIHKRRIGWVDTTPGSGQPERVRLFPFPPAADFGASRAECVFYGPGVELWIALNEARDCFWRLRPDQSAKTGWRLAAEPFRLHGGRPGFIESALVVGNVIFVTKSREDGSPCWLEAFSVTDGRIMETGHRLPTSTWVYGPAERDGVLWYVTDIRSTCNHGIYREDRLIVPGVVGSGLAFDVDENLIVAEYGMSRGPFGEPGAIVRIPAALLK